jgi:hypothetical protein
MKRSEMISIMDRVVNLSDNDLDRLLTAMEEAGMLPPLGKLNKLGISDNAWEPEDG